MDYYKNQLKMFELKNNSNESIKIKLFNDSSNSNYISVNNESIDSIIEYFQKIKNIILEPTKNEFNNKMKEIINNSEMYNRPTLIEKYGDYYFKYFRDINHPTYISTNHIICGDIFGVDSKNKNTYMCIFLDLRNDWNAIIASWEDINLIVSNADYFRNVSIKACKYILQEGFETIKYHNDDSELVELKSEKQLDKLIEKNCGEIFFIFKQEIK